MLGFFDGEFCFFNFLEGSGEVFPLKSPFTIPLGRGNEVARGLGGIPISPLKSPRAPHNPLETATVGARRPRRGATPDNPIKKYKHNFPD